MKNIYRVAATLSLGLSLSANAAVVELPGAQTVLCHDGAVKRGFTYDRSWNVVRGVHDRSGLLTATVLGEGRTSTRLTFAIRGLQWDQTFTKVRAYDEDGNYLTTCASKDAFGHLRIYADRCRPVMTVVPFGSWPDECGDGGMAYLLETRLRVQGGS